MRTTDCVFDPRVYRLAVTPPVVTYEDTSRFKNDGVMTAVTWTRLVSGLWVMNFNGTSSLITVVDAAKNRNVFAAGGTLLAWINPLSDGENDSGCIFNKSDGATRGYYFYVSGEAAGYMNLLFATLWTLGWGSWATTVAVIPVGRPVMVALTYDSSSIANDPLIYVNGVNYATTEAITPAGTVISDAVQNLIIGNNEAASYTFDGLIGRPRMYRYILTAAQIYSMFQNERGWVGV